MMVTTLSEFGNCIVCNWRTITANYVYEFDQYLYCCDDRPCKEKFKDVVMDTLSRGLELALEEKFANA